MSLPESIQDAVFATLKLAVLSGLVWVVITGAAAAISASAPTAEDICARVKPGMTVKEIEDATRLFEGWHLLRDDGVLVISSRPHYSNSPVCRVAIDPVTKRARSKSVGALQDGDWPTM